MKVSLTATIELLPGQLRCMWCGLRPETCKLYGAPTCNTCRDGGRKVRVQNYINRLRWAAERTR